MNCRSRTSFLQARHAKVGQSHPRWLGGGNAYWKPLTVQTLLGIEVSDNVFGLRTKADIEKHNDTGTTFRKYWHKVVLNRINGELCAYNTIRIIEKYNPKVWCIENPKTSYIWNYFDIVQGFSGIKNVAHYNNYDKSLTTKPTIFYSNINMELRNQKIKQDYRWSVRAGRDYNKWSQIPIELIKDILQQAQEKMERES